MVRQDEELSNKIFEALQDWESILRNSTDAYSEQDFDVSDEPALHL